MHRVDQTNQKSGQTMTVHELIQYLIASEFPLDAPVLAVWEGVFSGIRKENCSVVRRNGRDELHVDVEDYG